MQRIRALLEQAMAIEGAVSAKVRLAGADGQNLQILIQHGLSEGFVKDFSAIPPSAPAPSAIAFTSRRRVYVSNVADDPRATLYRDVAPREGFVAMQSTPIVGARGAALGALSTHFAAPARLSSADATVLDHCATTMGEVIEELGLRGDAQPRSNKDADTAP